MLGSGARTGRREGVFVAARRPVNRCSEAASRHCRIRRRARRHFGRALRTLCGSPARNDLDLCAGCEADLPLNDNVCEHCAEPLPRELSQPTLCGACLQASAELRRLRRAVSLCVSGRPNDSADQVRSANLSMAAFSASCWRGISRSRETRPELVIPVPLATQRYRERGFNQAREVARPVVQVARADIAQRSGDCDNARRASKRDWIGTNASRTCATLLR